METVNPGEVDSDSWLGFDWSDWMLLEPGTKKISNVPQTSGFFRIKKTDSVELDYVGQTGRKLRERIIHLANTVHREEKPDSVKSSAAHLWELKETGGRYEFSYANPNIARSETDRIGIENVMFYSHIKHLGRSPSVNLDRKLSSEENQGSVLSGLEWDNEGFRTRDWLGLNWTEPLELSEHTEVEYPKVVYRIWFQDFAPPLAYIGKSTNVVNRLVKHQKKFGAEALFSVAPLENNLKDVEAVLIADHYLKTNTLPKGQDGRRNRFSWKHED